MNFEEVKSKMEFYQLGDDGELEEIGLENFEIECETYSKDELIARIEDWLLSRESVDRRAREHLSRAEWFKTIFEKHTSIHQFAIYRDWFKLIYGDYESDGTGVMDVNKPLNKEIAYRYNEIENNKIMQNHLKELLNCVKSIDSENDNLLYLCEVIFENILNKEFSKNKYKH